MTEDHSGDLDEGRAFGNRTIRRSEGVRSRCWPRISASPRADSTADSGIARRCLEGMLQNWRKGRIAAIEKHRTTSMAAARRETLAGADHALFGEIEYRGHGGRTGRSEMGEIG